MMFPNPESSAKAQSQKSKASFTLIELLVMVAIIAVLVSLLLPSLQKAREAAKVVTCLNTLHSHGMAFQMYETENYQLPPMSVYNWPNLYPYLTYFLLAVDQNGQTSPGGLYSLLQTKCLNDPKSLFCITTEMPEFQYNTPENPFPNRSSYQYYPFCPADPHGKIKLDRLKPENPFVFDNIVHPTNHRLTAWNYLKGDMSGATYNDGGGTFLNDIYANWSALQTERTVFETLLETYFKWSKAD